MTFRLLTIQTSMIDIAGRGATFKKLGEVALQIILARYELEEGNYSLDDRNKGLRYLDGVTKSLPHFIPEAIIRAQRKLQPDKYSPFSTFRL